MRRERLPSWPGSPCRSRCTRTSRSARTRMPAPSRTLRATAPSAKRKWATPTPLTTNAPPPSTLTPARPSASPISASSPGWFSSAMVKSFMIDRPLRFRSPCNSSAATRANQVADEPGYDPIHWFPRLSKSSDPLTLPMLEGIVPPRRILQAHHLPLNKTRFTHLVLQGCHDVVMGPLVHELRERRVTLPDGQRPKSQLEWTRVQRVADQHRRVFELSLDLAQVPEELRERGEPLQWQQRKKGEIFPAGLGFLECHPRVGKHRCSLRV